MQPALNFTCHAERSGTNEVKFRESKHPYR